jgi:hypothetical protein
MADICSTTAATELPDFFLKSISAVSCEKRGLQSPTRSARDQRQLTISRYTLAGYAADETDKSQFSSIRDLSQLLPTRRNIAYFCL